MPAKWSRRVFSFRFYEGKISVPVTLTSCAFRKSYPDVMVPRLSCINLQRGPYFQAFDGSVALPVAGYNYNSVWTPLLAGLDCLAGVRGLEVRRETGKE